MAEFRSISDFHTLLVSEVNWVGQLTEGTSTLVPRTGDTVWFDYAFDATRTTQTNISKQKIFHYPETLQDKNLSSAIVRHGKWEYTKQSHPRHQLVRNFIGLPICLMQTGQKIIVVRMLQNEIVCIEPETGFLDKGMGKSCVLQITDFKSMDSKRTFLFSNLPPQIEEPMEKLIDEPYLTFEKTVLGVYVHVDTQKYSLIAVHTAFAQLLLSQPPTLRAGLQKEGEEEIFLTMTAMAYGVCETSVRRVLLAFARQWGLAERLIHSIPKMALLPSK